ncbi:hypothetical protein D3C85_751690 [compost metagenome]
MPRHAGQIGALVQPPGHVGPIAFDGGEGIDVRDIHAEDASIHLPQQGRLVIGGAAQHDAVQLHAVRRIQMGLSLIQIADAAVDADGQMRPLALQTPHQIIVQRRHVAVFLGRQALQPGLARMDDEVGDPDRRRGVHRGEQADFGVLIINADAAFDGGGDADRALDGRHAVGHEFRLAHQTGAELARLHPIRGAADVQVDLVIAVRFADSRRLGQLRRVRPTQLQRHRMLDRVKAQQPLAVAVDHSRRRHHLGIEQRPTAQRTVKRPTVAVGPVHHGRHGQSMSLVYRHLFSNIKKLEGGVCTRICDVLRRFFRVFDTSVHTERTRNGDVLETPVRNVAGPGETEGSLYKRDLPQTRRRAPVGHRSQGADRSRRGPYAVAGGSASHIRRTC